MESLFSSFPNSSLSEWKEKLFKDLKGNTFEDLSIWEDNGIRVAPFYNQENQTAESNLIFRNPDWEICTQIIIKNAKEANREALEALNGGVSGLLFQFEQENEFDLPALLNDIQIKFIYTSFKIKKNVSGFISKFQEYLEKENINIQEINYHIDFDPIAEYLQTGNKSHFNDTQFIDFIKPQEGIKNISVDATIYQNAGGNATTQLALTLAHLNEYFHLLEQKDALSNPFKINIKIAIGTSFFEEIAKMRAARILLTNLAKAYNINMALFITAENSDIYRAHLDIYNNILRDSISGLAAVMGGCDALLIHDFDKNIQQSSKFSERMARNQQLIFKEESYLNKVADIASGTYYLETLTQQFSEKAWSEFKVIEKKGGIIPYFENGDLLEELKTQKQKLIGEYKEGKRTLIGVNKHISPTEKTRDAPSFNQEKNGIQKLNIASEIAI